MVSRKTTVFLTVSLLLCFLVASACSSATSGGKKDSPPPPATAQGGNAATVDGQPISLAQLDARVAKQLYDARQQALGDMVNEALLEKEAKSQGITVEALTQKEVNAKITEPTPAEVDQVWEANKARMPGKTKEQVTPDIVKWLKDQKAAQLQQTFIQSLRAK